MHGRHYVGVSTRWSALSGEEYYRHYTKATKKGYESAGQKVRAADHTKLAKEAKRLGGEARRFVRVLVENPDKLAEDCREKHP